MSCNPANEQDSRDDGGEDGSRQLDQGSSSSGALFAVDGDATSLFQYILRDKVWGTNLDPPESAKDVIKPWHQRLSTAECVQSNVDDQLTITVPFTCPVRVKSIMINTGTGDFAPTRCRAFVNRPDGIDFDEADAATADTHPAGQPTTRIAATLGAVGSGKAQADFALLQGQEGMIEYPVSVARFSSTNSVTLVLSHSNATTLSRFFYLGFRGTAPQLSKDPSEMLDIATANAADKPVDGLREKRTASHGLAGGSGSGSQGSLRYVVSDRDTAQRIADLAQGSGSSPRRKGTAGSTAAPNTTPRKGGSSIRSGGGGAAAANDPSSPAPGATVSTSGAAVASDPASRRRSLSQPPPADTLARHLHQQQAKEQQQRLQQQQSAMTVGAGPSLLRTPGRSAATGKTPLRSAIKAGASTTAAATPGRRALGTPHRPGEHSVGTLAQTPATEMRKKRNEALIASAQRTREKRRQSTWGVGGWGGGREESPFDLLRRLARAPGFVVPPTPQQAAEDAVKMPPPPGSAAAASTAARRASSSSAASARDGLGAGPGTGGGRSSTSGRQSSMLRPGESVPGDLTRESDGPEDSADVNESRDASETSSWIGRAPGNKGGADVSLASEVGAARRKSLIRGGIFAALAERGRNVSARASDAASRLSLGLAGDVSALSATTSALGGLRETELEKSLVVSLGDLDDSSLASSSQEGLSLLTETDARALERLDELMRRSLFSNDSGLSLGGPGEDDDDQSRSRSRYTKSFMRSVSDPLQMEDEGEEDDEGGAGADTGDYSALLADHDAGGESMQDDSIAVDEPSIASSAPDAQSMQRDDDDRDRTRSRATLDDSVQDESHVTIGSTDAGGLSSEVSRAGLDANDSSLSRLQQLDDDLRSRTDILTDAGDISGISAPLEALSDQDDDDNDHEQGFGTASTDLDDDDDDAGSADDGVGAGDASVRKLDLMNPKDLNALLKRRIVRKRKARVSPYTGNTIPQLPASTLKDLFSSFLNPSAATQTSASLLGSSSSSGRRARFKLDKTTLEEVEEASHDFFASFAQQLHQQARMRTKRRSSSSSEGGGGVTMTELDVLSLLRQQGHVTARSDVTSIAHRLLPREAVDLMNLAKFASVGTELATPSVATMLRRVGARANETGSHGAVSVKKRARQPQEEEEQQEDDDDDDQDVSDDNDEGGETSLSRNAQRPASKKGRKGGTTHLNLPRTPIRRSGVATTKR